MKKHLSIILTLVLLALILSSCGQTNVNVNVNNVNQNSNVAQADSGGSDSAQSSAVRTAPAYAGSYNIGDTVRFGSYEQDNNTLNGKEPIEWTVLDKQGDVYLLISRCALDSKPYNDTKGETDGWNSSLERWLCEEFVSTAFTFEEQSHLCDGMKNEYFYGGYPFLLTKAEAEKYFGTSQARICSATAYAQAQGSYVKDGACGWWLRLENQNANAPRVNIKGEILTGSSSEGGAERTDYSVRPAVYLDVSGLNFASYKEAERNRILGMTDSQFGNAYFAPAINYYNALSGDASLLAVDFDYDTHIYPHGEEIDNGYCPIVDSRFVSLDGFKKLCASQLSSSLIQSVSSKNASAFYTEGGKNYTSEWAILGAPDVPVISKFIITSDSADAISVTVNGSYDLEPSQGIDEVTHLTMVFENGRWVIDTIKSE